MTNKVAVVVGSSSAIGAEICDGLLKKSWFVYGLSRQKMNCFGDNFADISCDLTNKEQTNEAIAAITKNRSQISLLIFNQAVTPLDRLQCLSDINISECLDINVAASVRFIRDCSSRLSERSNIIFIGSVAGRHRSETASCIYTASKYAINGLTKHLAFELAPKTRVNCVCPSQTDTSSLRSNVKEEDIELIAKKNPMRRLAVVKDIFNAIDMLIDENSGFINGACVDVNGGVI